MTKKQSKPFYYAPDAKLYWFSAYKPGIDVIPDPYKTIRSWLSFEDDYDEAHTEAQNFDKDTKNGISNKDILNKGPLQQGYDLMAGKADDNVPRMPVFLESHTYEQPKKEKKPKNEKNEEEEPLKVGNQSQHSSHSSETSSNLSPHSSCGSVKKDFDDDVQETPKARKMQEEEERQMVGGRFISTKNQSKEKRHVDKEKRVNPKEAKGWDAFRTTQRHKAQAPSAQYASRVSQKHLHHYLSTHQ